MASSQDHEEHGSNSKKRRGEDDGSSSTCSESDDRNIDKNMINPALVHEAAASEAAAAGNPLTVNSCSITQGSAPPKSVSNETNPPVQKVAPEAADNDPITPAARRLYTPETRRQDSAPPKRSRRRFHCCSLPPHGPPSQPLQPSPPSKTKYKWSKKIKEADSHVEEELDDPVK